MEALTIAAACAVFGAVLLAVACALAVVVDLVVFALHRAERLRRVAWPVVVVVVAACGSESGSSEAANLTIGAVESGVDEGEARRAADAAVADSRLEGLLEGHAFRIAEVRSPSDAPSGLVVTLEFEEPLDDDTDYPLDVCAIDTGGEPITGIVWLVEGDDISAVSPRWGDDIACGF